jgi:predicted TIM-barrel fold metal-dependent hydrolase
VGDYRLISGDSHVNEPPDLWTSRVTGPYRERVPHMERFEKGDAWVLEGALDPINFGSNCNVGLPPEQRPPWITWDQVRAGGYDPTARVSEQDEDGVDAEILYPTPRVSNQLFWNAEDVDFHLTCIRTYNDWLSEFSAHAPERLWGVAMLPNVGVDAAVAELERAMALPGLRGAMIGQYPHGGGVIEAEDDGLWAAIESMHVPLSIHVGFALTPAADKSRMQRIQASGVVRFTDAPIRVSQFVDSGVFDRFPNLSLVLVEVDSGWLPYLREQMNDRFERTAAASRPKIARRPGDYFETNVFSTFITDRYAVKNRHDVGVSQMLWSSDYPHSGADWPNSWKTIEDHFEGVDPDEKQAILAGNALRLYGSRATVSA